MHTNNLANEKYQALKDLFPNAITETIDENGEIVRAIDKDILMQEISTKVVEGKEERYQFAWPDKKKAILNANAPINKTLRPCREESVNFDKTENLYIEGDNLEVLKLLQETYLGKIKMIYTDPPYNTGNDFIYNDDFKESVDEYLENSGQYDEEGNRLEKNPETNGRFHTDWLNMMYSRLKLARNLLSDNGVIFISIDDNEVTNLKKICDELFGEANFISQLGWQKVYSPKNQAKYFSNDYEFILCYSKDITKFSVGSLPRTKKMNARYNNPDNDPRGDWKPGDCVGKGERKNGYYEVVSPSTGKVFNVAKGKHWVYAPDTMSKLLEDNRIYFGKDGNSFPSVKQFLSEVGGRKASSLLLHEDYGHTDLAKKEIINIFNDLNQVPFDTPKPSKLLKMLLKLGVTENEIIMDFFSGTSTTAHSVMELNSDDNGNRKYIMVQLPEETDEKSEAYKAGYKTIAEIGKERIRRAGKQILEENKDKEGIENLDIGFRVLKTDSSNMKDVYYSPADTEQNFLDDLADNIKEDRTSEDLLFQVMLDLGVSLSSKIESETIDGKEVFVVEDGFLIACFDKDVSEDTVKEIANKEPYYAVLRDKSMASDSVAANFDQIFASISPETIRRVI